MNKLRWVEYLWPNFYYQEVLYMQTFPICKKCRLQYPKSDLEAGYCVYCRTKPPVNLRKEKLLLIAVSFICVIAIILLLQV